MKGIHKPAWTQSRTFSAIFAHIWGDSTWVDKQDLLCAPCCWLENDHNIKLNHLIKNRKSNGIYAVLSGCNAKYITAEKVNTLSKTVSWGVFCPSTKTAVSLGKLTCTLPLKTAAAWHFAVWLNLTSNFCRTLNRLLNVYLKARFQGDRSGIFLLFPLLSVLREYYLAECLTACFCVGSMMVAPNDPGKRVTFLGRYTVEDRLVSIGLGQETSLRSKTG